MTVDGLDVTGPSFETWIADHVPAAAGPYDATLITGGNSNITARVRGTAGPEIIVRRPPLGRLASTAHDVLREHRIYAALQDTDVPVPRTYGACDDQTVLGAPFFAMASVDGVVLNTIADANEYPTAAKPALADSLVDAMLALHAVEPDAVGLGDLSRREDYLGRQLRRWRRQYAVSPDADLDRLDDLWRSLSASVPPQQRTAIVHGDLRLGNVLASPGGAVAAVLDWELTALGDVLADLGWLVASWVEEGEEVISSMEVTCSSGFPPRAQLVSRYAERTGSDLERLSWYVAFAHWRSAAISVGIIDRARQHGASDPDVADRLRGIRAAIEHARAALETGLLR